MPSQKYNTQDNAMQKSQAALPGTGYDPRARHIGTRVPGLQSHIGLMDVPAPKPGDTSFSRSYTSDRDVRAGTGTLASGPSTPNIILSAAVGVALAVVIRVAWV